MKTFTIQLFSNGILANEGETWTPRRLLQGGYR
jgi:hypothetical protein